MSCGRVSFDPLTGANGDGNPAGDGTTSGDGAMSGDGGTTPDASPPDAQPAACAEAIPVTVNVPITRDTCSTGLNRVDGCAGAALNEVVFKFTAPASGAYTVQTHPAGTTNVITTGDVDNQCAANAGCFGLRSTSFSAGQTTYYVVEASTGACQNIDFSITMP